MEMTQEKKEEKEVNIEELLESGEKFEINEYGEIVVSSNKGVTAKVQEHTFY